MKTKNDPHVTEQPEDIACVWTQDSDGSAWATGCGNLFEVTDGTPKENGMCWCCFCGRELNETPYTDDEQANNKLSDLPPNNLNYENSNSNNLRLVWINQSI